MTNSSAAPPLPRAFLVQENPKLDFQPLDQHAQWPPRVIFGAGQVTLEPQHAIAHARRVLSELAPRDFLVLSGDPVMIGICMAVVGDYLGRVRVLRWNRWANNYTPVVLDFDDTETPTKGNRNARGSRTAAKELAEDSGELD